MAPVLKDFPKASFNKIAFPFTSRSARLEVRYHAHEYPQMAGASIERLGRKFWTFTFNVPFHTTFANFPDLYPDRLNALTELAATAYTAPLLVPELGEIRALLTKVERTRQGRILSGEDAVLEFIEDDLEPFRRATAPASRAELVDAAVTVSQSRTFVVASDLSEAVIKQADADLGSLLDLADSLSALRDQTTLYGRMAQGKLGQLQRLCRSVHELLKGPDLDPLRRGLRDLWDAARRLQQDLTDSGQPNAIKPFVVPSTLSIGQIAQRLYRDAGRGGEILALNRGVIHDPYAVPAGARLLVYAQ